MDPEDLPHGESLYNRRKRPAISKAAKLTDDQRKAAKAKRKAARKARKQ